MSRVDTKLRFEIWTPPWSGDFKRLATLEPVSGNGTVELSSYQDAAIGVAASDPKLSLLAGGWVVVALNDHIIDEFEPRRIPKPGQRPAVIDLSGPTRNGLVEEVAILPRNYPHHKDGVLDWIWGGEGVLPPLGLGDLASIKAQYELYLERARYELEITATGGTFKLGANGENTADISVSASASTIKNALEDLSSVSSAYVEETSDGVFQIVFLNPTQLTVGLSVDTSGLTGGSASVTEENAGFDSSTNPTFTVEVTTGDGVDTTSPLAWNVSARNLEGTPVGTPTGLQGLDNVSDVTVTGSGTYGDPWAITFYAPPMAEITDVTFAVGDAVLTEIQAGTLDPAPITISKPADQQAGDPADYGNYGTPALEVVTDVVDTDADYSILVHALTQFAGSQVTFRVTPGETYADTTVRVRPTVAGRFAIVARTIFGDLIRRAEFDLAADTFQDLTLPDWVAPPGADEAILRVAAVDSDPDNIADFYVNWQGAVIHRGEEKATAATIVGKLLAAAHDRGTATWMHLATDDEDHDTAGTALTPISFTQFFGGNASLAHTLRDLNRRGYQWRVVRCQHENSGYIYDLELYHAPTGEIEDLTGAGGPVIYAGTKGFASSQVVERTRDRTVLYGHGAGSLIVEKEDAAAVAGMGRRERVVDVESAATGDDVETVLDAIFASDESNDDGSAVEMTALNEHLPGVDYRAGSKVTWQLEGLEKQAKVVRRFSWIHGNPARFQVQGSKVVDGETAIAQAVNLLLTPIIRRRTGDQGGFTALPAPSSDASSGAHIHLLADEQEVDAEPIEFAALLASPLATTIPAFPTSEVTIAQPGYYPFYVDIEFDGWFLGGDIWITRTRAGDTSQVWPPPGASDLWSSPGGSRFTDIAPAIDCEPGDVYQLWVDCGEEVTVKRAVFVPWLADRSSGKLATSQPTINHASTGVQMGADATLDLNLPTIQEGDLLIAVVVSNSRAIDIDGWTSLANKTAAVSFGLRVSVWARIATASGNDAVVSWTTGHNNSGVAATVMSFNQPGTVWTTDSPVVQLADFQSGGSVPFPETTPTLTGWQWVLPFAGHVSSLNSTPAGYDTVAETYATGVSDESLWIGSDFANLAGPVTPGNMSLSGVNAGAFAGVILVRGN